MFVSYMVKLRSFKLQMYLLARNKERLGDADDETAMLQPTLPGNTTGHDLPALLAWTSVQR